jgi:hypothetical protein
MAKPPNNPFFFMAAGNSESVASARACRNQEYRLQIERLDHFLIQQIDLICWSGDNGRG